jgi:ribonuclease BN (tRNA processing enzyme)
MYKETDQHNGREHKGPGRRRFLRDLAGIATLGAAASLAPRSRSMGMAFAQGGAPSTGRGGVPLSGTHAILLGTKGGPGVDLKRNETASAAVVDGVPYLVDCGYGTLRALVECGIGLNQISGVFFTHLHDDHTADLALLLTLQWTDGRTNPMDIYGPYGTAAMVKDAMAFFKANTEIRIADEGRTVRPESLFHGHDLVATDRPAPVLKDEHVTVTSIENTHFPERSRAKMPHRSLAFRFESKTRSIVFSGDTAYSRNLVDLAQGADVFICEVLDQDVHDQMAAQAKAAAEAGNPNNIFRHVAETHSTPTDVGRMASEANVKTVVLNHLVQGAVTSGRLEVPVTSYIDVVRKVYSGEVIVGQDLMVI